MRQQATRLDNVVFENCFRTLKICTIHQTRYMTYDELKSDMIEFINYYHNKRINITPIYGGQYDKVFY